jgi:formate-dependent phosphoribosylglycinamide formyltransferase (GAR transformylase)
MVDGFHPSPFPRETRLKVLVVGSGGREHALAWAIRRSPRVDTIWIAPGNAGTPGVGENVDIAATDIDALLSFARDRRADLTVVGPEAPLMAGIVDRFREAKMACYGPTGAAARLEGSKAFAKDFMRRHRIPTAAFATFDDAARARAFARSLSAPVVVKADGLAAGKGVVIAADHAEADRAIDEMLLEGRFGAAGRRVVVEEFLSGEEVSVHAVCAGGRVVATERRITSVRTTATPVPTRAVWVRWRRCPGWTQPLWHASRRKSFVPCWTEWPRTARRLPAPCMPVSCGPTGGPRYSSSTRASAIRKRKR